MKWQSDHICGAIVGKKTKLKSKGLDGNKNGKQNIWNSNAEECVAQF